MLIILTLLFHALWITGGVVVIQAAWSLIRMAESGLSDRNLRIWSQHLADALARDDDPVTALHAAQHRVRWPYPARLRRCAHRLETGADASLISALEHCDLLPKALIPLGRAAESTSPQTLQRFLARLTPRVPTERSSLAGLLGPWLAASIVLGLLLSFLNVAIIPKFELILRDLGMPAPWAMELLISTSRFLSRQWWWIAPAGLVIGALAWSGFFLARWNIRRQSRLGDLLLEGLALGQTEMVLADIGASVHPSRAASLQRASAEGDLRGLLRASGFAGSDATGLAREMQRQADRQATLTMVAALLIPLFAPICFGIVVGLICYAFHSCLIELLYRLGGIEP